MIFPDKISDVNNILEPEINRLFDLALKKQADNGDLLLMYANGFYYKDPTDESINPHVIGLSSEGHSELAHCSFIDKYRSIFISKYTLSEYLKLHEYSQEKKEEIDRLVDFEEMTIQLEMLIYLKFWEADMIIKKLYQFVRILSGEHYDWYFKIKESNRDTDATDSRQELIRVKIRNALKDISSIICNLIESTYKTQIRNSIAHSNYSFVGRNIHLNNYIKNDPASPLISISFDEWINIFHNTLALHNQYISLNNKINEYYIKQASESENSIHILITEESGKQYNHPLIMHNGRWIYKPNY